MAYTPTPPTVDPSQKGPVLQGANDREQKPYVGKPKPMPNPVPQKPRYGSSDGSNFDFQAYLAGKHRPRPVQVLPGQGQGPMPVGTKPLPSPVVKDTRGFGGVGLEDWIKNHPNGPIYDEGPWGGGRPTADMGDNRLNRGGGGQLKNGGQYGGQPPWLEGRMLPMDIGPGSANERAQAALRAEWEAKNGPWQGGGMMGPGQSIHDGKGGYINYDAGRLGGPTLDTGDNRLNRGGGGMMSPRGEGGYDGRPLGVVDGDRRAPGWDGSWGMTTGLWNPPDRMPGERPNDYYPRSGLDAEGFPVGQNPFWGGGGMKPGGPRMGGWNNQLVEGTPEYGDWVRRMKLQHGEDWTPDGGGMTRGGDVGFGEDPNKRYGGGMNRPMAINDVPQNIRDLWANGGADPFGKPGGMGPGGQDPMYGGAGTGPSYGGPNQARDFNVPNYGAPVQRGPGAPGMPSGGKPPQGPQPGMPGQGGRPRPQRPQRPQQANPQAMQQGAQALYNDNTIPHEFKGQLLQAAQSGNAQAFNEMLFNSGIPHETKLRLQQMFGYGSGAGAAPQAATPDQGQNQNPYQDVVNSARDAYNASKGSPYYGAF